MLRVESQRAQPLPDCCVVEKFAKHAHGGPREPSRGHGKIEALLLQRNEAEPVLAGNGVDRGAPVGPL